MRQNIEFIPSKVVLGPSHPYSRKPGYWGIPRIIPFRYTPLISIASTEKKERFWRTLRALILEFGNVTIHKIQMSLLRREGKLRCFIWYHARREWLFGKKWPLHMIKTEKVRQANRDKEMDDKLKSETKRNRKSLRSTLGLKFRIWRKPEL